MASRILKKLTIATFVGTKDEVLDYAKLGAAQIPDPEREGKFILAPVGKNIPLMEVLGVVNAIKAGVHKETGTDYVKLFGNFKATNLQTGEVLPDITLCLLPNFVATPIAAAVANSVGDAAVSFGVRLLVKYSAKSAVGYEYEAESLLAPEVSNPIKALEAALVGQGVALAKPGVKFALPAPTTAPAPAPAASKGGKK